MAKEENSRQTNLNVPKEIWRMVDYLYHKGMQTKGLFLQQGDPILIKRIRKALDTGADFDLVRNIKSLNDQRRMMSFQFTP